MTHSEPCYYSTRLLDKLKSLDTNNKLDYSMIEKAIFWAKKYHDGQFRKSGEPYYSHPCEVAYIASEYKLTTNVIVASILHDIVEDTDVTVGMIVDNFSWRIAEMVDRLTRDRPDGTKLSIIEILNHTYEKNDKEVGVIKFSDRIHNMQTLHAMSEYKKQEIALESASTILYFSEDINLEKILNILIAKIISPKSVSYLNKLYSKKFSSDNYQLPSLD